MILPFAVLDRVYGAFLDIVDNLPATADENCDGSSLMLQLDKRSRRPGYSIPTSAWIYCNLS